MHINERNEAQFSGDIYEIDSIWWYNHLRHTTTEKYDSNGESWYYDIYDNDGNTTNDWCRKYKEYV